MSQAASRVHAQGFTLNRMMSDTSGIFSRCFSKAAICFFVADAFAGSLHGTMPQSAAI